MEIVNQTSQNLAAERVETIEEHTEFETKYRVDGKKVYEFKKIVNAIPDKKGFIYIEGPDHYYTKPNGDMLRYRKADNDKSGRAEVTFKEKPYEAKNNIIRKEVNWRVDKTPFHTIHEGALMNGFHFNFKIWKACHIYDLKDATLVFYTVIDEKESVDHFVEIEVDEATIHKLTEKEAWAVIEKYEKIFEPLGITYRNRLRKSLREMYEKEIDYGTANTGESDNNKVRA